MDIKREKSLDFIKIVATILSIFHHYQQVTEVYFNNGINFMVVNFILDIS